MNPRLCFIVTKSVISTTSPLRWYASQATNPDFCWTFTWMHSFLRENSLANVFLLFCLVLPPCPFFNWLSILPWFLYPGSYFHLDKANIIVWHLPFLLAIKILHYKDLLIYFSDFPRQLPCPLLQHTVRLLLYWQVPGEMETLKMKKGQ